MLSKKKKSVFPGNGKGAFFVAVQIIFAVQARRKTFFIMVEKG